MRVYTLHHPIAADVLKDDPVLIKEGFNWPAALFTSLWALWSGLWIASVLIFAAGIGLHWLLALAGANDAVQFAAGVGFSAIIGFSANDWRRGQLFRRGYRLQGIIAADSKDAARRRWFDLHPPAASGVEV